MSIVVGRTILLIALKISFGISIWFGDLAMKRIFYGAVFARKRHLFLRQKIDLDYLDKIVMWY